MTYKTYIAINGIKDSKQAFKEYLEKYEKLYNTLPDNMKKQVIKSSYNFRFIDSTIL